MRDRHSLLRAELFLEVYDQEDKNTFLYHGDEAGFFCAISDTPYMIECLKNRYESLDNSQKRECQELMYELLGEIKEEENCRFILFFVSTKTNRLLHYTLGSSLVLIKDINSDFIEIENRGTKPLDKEHFFEHIKTYPLENISTLFVGTTTLSELLFKKSYQNAFSKKDILQTLSNLGSELVEENRFSFVFLNNQIGSELDTSRRFDTKPTIDNIAVAEGRIENLLESYFKGNPQNARTLIVVNELLMNGYEHGVLKVDPVTKNKHMRDGNYDDFLKELEEGAKGEISIEVYLYKNGVLQINIDDFGEGFSENILKEYEKLQYRGRGIILAKRMTDALFFSKNGAKVSFFINYKLRDTEKPLPIGMLEDDILKRSKVLYVEDDRVIRSIFEKSLEKLVGRLFTATNGKEGLEVFQDMKPDIVISDVSMPQMNGIEMVKQIRNIDKDVPVLITTAYDADESIVDAISVGVDKFIPKPIDIKKLKTALNSFAKSIYYNQKHDEKIKKLDIRSHTNYLEEQQKLAREKQDLIIRDDRGYIKNCSIDVLYRPLETLSGDIYGIYRIDEQKSVILTADCMGKGLVASVTSVLAAAFLDRSISMGGHREDFSFERVCRDFIDFIQKYLLPEETLSFSILILDFAKKEIEYTSYGMYPIYLKDIHQGSSTLLASTNPPLMKGEDGYIGIKKPMPKKFSMVIYTDGACEFEGYNYKRLIKFFDELQSSESLIDSYKKEVLLHTKEIDDDCTIITICGGLDETGSA